MSPGWQSRALQIPFSVENLIAAIFPVLMLDRLTFDIPTFSASWFSWILRSAMTLSRRSIIVMGSQRVVRLVLEDGSVAEDDRQAVHHDAHEQRPEEDEQRLGHGAPGRDLQCQQHE